MNEGEKKQFFRALLGAAEITGKDLSEASMALWWELLRGYPIADVLQAIQAHLRDPAKGMYMPKPADLLAEIERAAMDREGIPPPEIAYQQAAGYLPMTHAIVLEARLQAKLWDSALCQHEGEYATRKRFEAVYGQMLAQAKQGQQFLVPSHLREKYAHLEKPRAAPRLVKP